LTPTAAQATLTRVNGDAASLYGQIWQVDAAPTAAQSDALASTEHGGAGVLERWTEFKKSDVPALNRRLHEKQAPAIRIEADQTVEESNDEE